MCSSWYFVLKKETWTRCWFSSIWNGRQRKEKIRKKRFSNLELIHMNIGMHSRLGHAPDPLWWLSCWWSSVKTPQYPERVERFPPEKNKSQSQPWNRQDLVTKLKDNWMHNNICYMETMPWATTRGNQEQIEVKALLQLWISEYKGFTLISFISFCFPKKKEKNPIIPLSIKTLSYLLTFVWPRDSKGDQLPPVCGTCPKPSC